MFICSKCGNEFDDAMRAVGGYRQCRPCRAAYVSAWRAAHPGRNAELCRQRFYRDPERARKEQAEYRARPENAEIARKRTREWYRENKARAKAWEAQNRRKRQDHANKRHRERFEAEQEYAEKHRRNIRFCRARRRAAEAANLAILFASEIKAIYDACPPGHHVDHIHPLLGENFSGLHVPWNLQYLPARENFAKSNKLMETV